MSYVREREALPHATGQIKLHDAEAFEGMRAAGFFAAQALDALIEEVRPGVSTAHLDRCVFEFAMDHDIIPATLFYRGFRHSSCTSVNHVVCHGIPSERILREGDIINIDITFIKDGWHGDSSRMFYAGTPSRKARRLVETTYAAMMKGIAAVRPGATIGDIGAAIQKYVEERNMSVVREFCGHGIGRVFHDAPNVFHFGKPGKGEILREGMFFTIEPMINLGRPEIKILSDGWTAVTRDRSLSAQFEHSVAVTATDCEIFTQSPTNHHHPPYETT